MRARTMAMAATVADMANGGKVGRRGGVGGARAEAFGERIVQEDCA